MKIRYASRGWQFPRVKSIELYMFYAANNVDQFTLQILAALSPSSHYRPAGGDILGDSRHPASTWT